MSEKMQPQPNESQQVVQQHAMAAMEAGIPALAAQAEAAQHVEAVAHSMAHQPLGARIPSQAERDFYRGWMEEVGRDDQTDPRNIDAFGIKARDDYAETYEANRETAQKLFDELEVAATAQEEATEAVHRKVQEAGVRTDKTTLVELPLVQRARDKNPGKANGRIPVFGPLQPDKHTPVAFETRISRRVSLGLDPEDPNGTTELYAEFTETEGVVPPGKADKLGALSNPSEALKQSRRRNGQPEVTDKKNIDLSSEMGYKGSGDIRHVGVKIYKGPLGIALAAKVMPDEDLDLLYAPMVEVGHFGMGTIGPDGQPISDSDVQTLNPAQLGQLKEAVKLEAEGSSKAGDAKHLVGNFHLADSPDRMTAQFQNLTGLVELADTHAPILHPIPSVGPLSEGGKPLPKQTDPFL